MRLLVLALLVACGANDVNRHTRAFVAPSTCGQGPYEIHFTTDAKTGGDGVEIIACTPRRLSGHVSFAVNNYEVIHTTFGDATDNARCLGGTPTAVTAAASGGDDARGATGGGGIATSAGPKLIERPFTGSETPFPDELCKDLGLVGQQVLGTTMLMRTETENGFAPPGSDLRIELWSDVPNDLDGVVFMVRQLTSKKTPQQVAREEAKRDKRHDEVVRRPERPVDHGPPPAPLVEEQPPRPVATATWIPGYWSWTGVQWGWVAGSWQARGLPAPRVEVPGTAPHAGAVWIGGTWTLRAGQYIWISGRWR